ncbi:hypothetical protein BTR42_01475 [Streptococcus gallolyticus subsp. gallolyticus DSM 16831]|nr:hypothetical protein BTR42_01475 [Streptococcus gallolyticus subsp. gallolyticus DSM 16831]
MQVGIPKASGSDCGTKKESLATRKNTVFLPCVIFGKYHVLAIITKPLNHFGNKTRVKSEKLPSWKMENKARYDARKIK